MPPPLNYVKMWRFVFQKLWILAKKNLKISRNLQHYIPLINFFFHIVDFF